MLDELVKTVYVVDENGGPAVKTEVILLEDIEEKYNKLYDLALRIKDWAEAYPKHIFKEPTPDQIYAVCKELGFPIDRISASVLREFTVPWGKLAREALGENP